MTQDNEPFFLFVASIAAPSAKDKLLASGIPYRRKLLESTPENWDTIAELLEDPNLIGALIKLTSRTCDLLMMDRYAPQARRLLQSLREVRHMIFVHESILTGERAEQVPLEDDDIEFSFLYDDYYFNPPSGDVRDRFRDLVNTYNLNLMPYKTNAEMSVLAGSFIEDSNKRLLFRVYVPSGRMWANEAEKFIGLFGDWLWKVKGQRVRQDGYTTPQGQVYEFYGDSGIAGETLAYDLDQFADFLDMCVENPDMAHRVVSADVAGPGFAALVARYAKEARRLKLDLKHEREARVLSIRHRLESELLDFQIDPASVHAEVECLVPQVPALSKSLTLSLPQEIAKLSPSTIILNQQFIEHVHGIVAQELSGTMNLSPESLQLLELIKTHASSQSTVLESAVHELEDEDAERIDRIRAGQRLKGFLFKIGPKVGSTVLSILQKYLENKLGL